MAQNTNSDTLSVAWGLQDETFEEDKIKFCFFIPLTNDYYKLEILLGLILDFLIKVSVIAYLILQDLNLPSWYGFIIFGIVWNCFYYFIMDRCLKKEDVMLFYFNFQIQMIVGVLILFTLIPLSWKVRTEDYKLGISDVVI